MSDGGIKIVSENRKARHNYFIEDTYEAGMVLLGTEVKALRDGKANLMDAYAVFKHGELFLINAHIAPYTHGNQQNHEPLRTRKLLLKSDELEKLWKKSEIRGYSLVPTKIYFKKGLAKVEIALGRGKKNFDKRDSIKEKDMKRSMERITRTTRR
ncbi:SsrA-binding protein SmpB [bacterium]|nr:SsrA-binding protein SmpB [bacterium]